MTRSAVEIDDEDRRTESGGAPQQPHPRIATEIIDDQAALPLFAEFGDHSMAAGEVGDKRTAIAALEPDGRKVSANGASTRKITFGSNPDPIMDFKRIQPNHGRPAEHGFDAAGRGP